MELPEAETEGWRLRLPVPRLDAALSADACDTFPTGALVVLPC